MATRFRRRREDEPEERGGPEEQGERDAPEQHEESEEGQSGTGQAGAAAAAESPEELARQRDEYLELWQRARADYQNLRRRSLSDAELAIRRAREGLLHELLLVLDYLDMALATECRTEEGQSLLTGVRMTRDQLLGVLEREGVRAVPEGGAFDPAVHQAVSTVESGEREPGQVVATVRRGYLLGDHPLRHAHVVVEATPGGGDGQGDGDEDAMDTDPPRSGDPASD